MRARQILSFLIIAPLVLSATVPARAGTDLTEASLKHWLLASDKCADAARDVLTAESNSRMNEGRLLGKPFAELVQHMLAAYADNELQIAAFEADEKLSAMLDDAGISAAEFVNTRDYLRIALGRLEPDARLEAWVELAVARLEESRKPPERPLWEPPGDPTGHPITGATRPLVAEWEVAFGNRALETDVPQATLDLVAIYRDAIEERLIAQDYITMMGRAGGLGRRFSARIPGVGIIGPQANPRYLRAEAANSWGANTHGATPCYGLDGKAMVRALTGRSSADIFYRHDTAPAKFLTSTALWDLAPVFAPDGQRILFYSNTMVERVSAHVMRPDGTGLVCLTANRRPVWDARFSSSGPSLAFVSGDGAHSEVFILDGSEYIPQRLTRNDVVERYPVFTPDGKQVVFARTDSDLATDFWVMDSDGGGEKQLTHDGQWKKPVVYSPDGRQLLYFQLDESSPERLRVGLWRMAADGAQPERLVEHATFAAFVDGGQRVAFVAPVDAPGESEVFVMHADGTDKRQLTRLDGRVVDLSPYPAGGRLLFVSQAQDALPGGEGQIYSVDVSTGELTKSGRTFSQ